MKGDSRGEIVSGQIIVSVYDGGGINVRIDNYNPISFHVRGALPSDLPIAAEAIANTVKAALLEWMRYQHRTGKVRTV